MDSQLPFYLLAVVVIYALVAYPLMICLEHRRASYLFREACLAGLLILAVIAIGSIGWFVK